VTSPATPVTTAPRPDAPPELTMAKAQPAALDPGMTLVEHLTELRKRLIISVMAVAICMLIAFFAYNWIIDILLHPYRDLVNSRPEQAFTNGKLITTDPLEGFGVRIKTAAYAGIGLAMPVILWQVWKFVTPGLYPTSAATRSRSCSAPSSCSSWAPRSPTGPCQRPCSGWSTSRAATSSPLTRRASTSSWSCT
jgi:hypothetical protein